MSPFWSQINERLFATLERCQERGFTGCLDIRLGKARPWRCHFVLGYLAWIDGGTSSWQRWQQQLVALSDTPLPDRRERLARSSISTTETGDSPALLPVRLLRAGVLVPDRLAILLRELCREFCFDIVWEIERQERSGDRSGELVLTTRSGRRSQWGSALPHTWLLPPQWLRVWAREDWLSWQAITTPGLRAIGPHAVPLIVEPRLLEAQLAPQTFQSISLLLDGRRALRDIALAVGCRVVSLARLLDPYLQRGWLKLVPQSQARPAGATDVAEASPSSPVPAPELTKTSSGRLVACVDDSPQMQALIKMVALAEGYEFLGLVGNLQTCPILAAKQPDLIFLDVAMPAADGYDLCQKLRRIDALQEVPIMMLSSHLIDRSRARAVGATRCLAKPISPQQLSQEMAWHFHPEQRCHPAEKTTHCCQCGEERSVRPEPVRSVSLPHIEGIPSGAIGGRRERSMLVACIDDSVAMRRAFEQVVTEQGHRFLGLSGRTTVVRELFARKPDLILLDLALPYLNGYELCQKLRRVAAFQETPIAVFSSSAVNLARAQIAGATIGLEKPTAPAQMRWILTECLRGDVSVESPQLKAIAAW